MRTLAFFFIIIYFYVFAKYVDLFSKALAISDLYRKKKCLVNIANNKIY